ncbi:hypothetical protein [Acinetobacter higginsii]|uniref:hypothetical protein n=1 Tax=Acinetobacter higginsii TaxID=70347 RepID=UPI00300BD2E0
MEIAKIREAAPIGATHFRCPLTTHRTLYYRVEGILKLVLYWTEKDLGFWQKTELTLKDLADLGAMPLDYEPIDWLERLGGIDQFLYSKGKYLLFEHWQEDGKNIYSKAKYPIKENFLKGAGKLLSEKQIEDLEAGESITLKQEDGTTLFFKYIDL